MPVLPASANIPPRVSLSKGDDFSTRCERDLWYKQCIKYLLLLIRNEKITIFSNKKQQALRLKTIMVMIALSATFFVRYIYCWCGFFSLPQQLLDLNCTMSVLVPTFIYILIVLFIIFQSFRANLAPHTERHKLLCQRFKKTIKKKNCLKRTVFLQSRYFRKLRLARPVKIPSKVLGRVVWEARFLLCSKNGLSVWLSIWYLPSVLLWDFLYFKRMPNRLQMNKNLKVLSQAQSERSKVRETHELLVNKKKYNRRLRLRLLLMKKRSYGESPRDIRHSRIARPA